MSSWKFPTTCLPSVPSIYLECSDIVRDGGPELRTAGEPLRRASASRSRLRLRMKKKMMIATIEAKATRPIVRPTAAPVLSFEPPPSESLSVDFLPDSIGSAGVGMTVTMRSTPDSVTVAKASVDLEVEDEEVVEEEVALVLEDYITS